jgi:hypothetical protein
MIRNPLLNAIDRRQFSATVRHRPLFDAPQQSVFHASLDQKHRHRRQV